MDSGPSEVAFRLSLPWFSRCFLERAQLELHSVIRTFSAMPPAHWQMIHRGCRCDTEWRATSLKVEEISSTLRTYSQSILLSVTTQLILPEYRFYSILPHESAKQTQIAAA